MCKLNFRKNRKNMTVILYKTREEFLGRITNKIIGIIIKIIITKSIKKRRMNVPTLKKVVINLRSDFIMEEFNKDITLQLFKEIK